MLSLSLMGFCTFPVQARDLTPEEKSVCSSLRACLDIASRHAATEFDYNVLETEFGRFGKPGKTALFSLLESDDGHADIASLISALGPLTAEERQRVLKHWTQARSQIYLPLLLDGHPLSRDLLLQSLGHPQAHIREQVRKALIRLPVGAERAPLSDAVQPALLAALQKDPIPQAAPYLERLNTDGFNRDFTTLLRSGESDIVKAAYSALYRNNPSQAFNGLIAEMGRIETTAQARAIGQMLASRHKSRADGFYLNFARKISGDPNLSALARASGLHTVLMVADGPMPELTPARLEGFLALVQGQPFMVQDQYLSYLQNAQAQTALGFIWKTAQTEKWINRDRIIEYYAKHPAYETMRADLIQSNDIRTFSAGLRKAKAKDRRLVQKQIDHPVRPIALAARNFLKLRAPLTGHKTCPIGLFDVVDIRAQMPFFESGWMVASDQARVSFSREHLLAAHPTRTGWLAGYDLKKPNSRPGHSGGALLHYENTSGEFETIGDFSGPLAILPSQALELGQTTEQFWVVDAWGGGASDVSAYTVNLSGDKPRITHIGALPKTAQGFAVNPDGDLVIAFADKNQMPIKVSKSGTMALYCSEKRSASAILAAQ